MAAMPPYAICCQPQLAAAVQCLKQSADVSVINYVQLEADSSFNGHRRPLQIHRSNCYDMWPTEPQQPLQIVAFFRRRLFTKTSTPPALIVTGVFEAQRDGVWRGGAGVSRHSVMGFGGAAPWGLEGRRTDKTLQ